MPSRQPARRGRIPNNQVVSPPGPSNQQPVNIDGDPRRTSSTNQDTPHWALHHPRLPPNSQQPRSDAASSRQHVRSAAPSTRQDARSGVPSNMQLVPVNGSSSGQVARSTAPSTRQPLARSTAPSTRQSVARSTASSAMQFDVHSVAPSTRQSAARSTAPSARQSDVHSVAPSTRQSVARTVLPSDSISNAPAPAPSSRQSGRSGAPSTSQSVARSSASANRQSDRSRAPSNMQLVPANNQLVNARNQPSSHASLPIRSRSGQHHQPARDLQSRVNYPETETGASGSSVMTWLDNVDDRGHGTTNGLVPNLNRNRQRNQIQNWMDSDWQERDTTFFHNNTVEWGVMESVCDEQFGRLQSLDSEFQYMMGDSVTFNWNPGMTSADVTFSRYFVASETTYSNIWRPNGTRADQLLFMRDLADEIQYMEDELQECRRAWLAARRAPPGSRQNPLPYQMSNRRRRANRARYESDDV